MQIQGLTGAVAHQLPQRSAGTPDPALPTDEVALGSAPALPRAPQARPAAPPPIAEPAPPPPEAAAPPPAADDFQARLKQAERRQTLTELFAGRDPEPLASSEDPLVARAACFLLGRELPATDDPLANLYQPFHPGKEDDGLAHNRAFHKFLATVPVLPPGSELPDSHGRMVSVSRALVDRLVNDPQGARSALNQRGMGSWPNLENYYALIQPEPPMVEELLARVESAYAERGSTEAMERADKASVSVLASLPLTEAQDKRLQGILYQERLQERNWLGDVVDQRVRVPRWDELKAQLAEEPSMAERLSIGREMLGMGLNMYTMPTEQRQLQGAEALVKSLSTLSPVALQLHADQLLAELPARLAAIPQVPETEHLVPLYELATFMRCPGVELKAAEVLPQLAQLREAFSWRTTKAADFLAWSCVEHEATRRPSLETAALGLQAACDFALSDEIARSTLRPWRAALQEHPGARKTLENLPAPANLDGAGTARVLSALLAAEHDPSLLPLAPAAIKLLYREDQPGKQICAQYLYDELAPALVARQAEKLPGLTPAERTTALRSLDELCAAAKLDRKPVRAALLAHGDGWEQELSRSQRDVIETHQALTAAPHPPDLGWHYLEASQLSLQDYAGLKPGALDDFADLLSLVGPLQREQAYALSQELGTRVAAGESRESVRTELIERIMPKAGGPTAGVVQRDGLLQVGGVRLRKRA